MNCGVSRDDLWEWVHGDSEPDSDIGRHVATCEHCSDAISQMSKLMSDVQQVAEDSSTGAEPALPESVGPYRVLRKIGEGGMGIVFEAEQQSPQRRVALKVVRAGLISDEFQIKLFHREMQTLARLNHPSIAAIYDAGLTPDGQRYFAMELVEGIRLDEYVAGSRFEGRDSEPMLAPRQRWWLFHRICEAISYAHQRGVIHRDLKPANILINADGVPKILDFGLARAVADDPSMTMVSEAGRLLGTPAYMSPEQTLADPHAVDVRSDVYTLGVMLYELTTGAFPYDVRQATIVDICKVITDASPRNPRAINSNIPADIETITLKALEKEPERRYQSVAELGDDVERFLENHPIQARPASRAYKIKKLVQRHKLPFALITAILFLSIGSAVVFAIQKQQVSRERDTAKYEADKFRRINNILTGFLNASNAWEQGSSDTTVKQVLDGMSRRIEDELSDSPELAATIRHTLGMTYRMLSEYENAEQHLRYAYETRLALLGENDPETLAALDDLGELYHESGRATEAEQTLRRALAGRERILGKQHPSTAETLNSIGVVLKTAGELDAAEAYFQRALGVRQHHANQLMADDQTKHKDRRDAYNAVAQTRNNLAALMRARAAALGDDLAAKQQLWRVAETHYVGALELRTEWLGDHPEVAKMHNNYAKLLIDMGQGELAEEHLRAGIEILERTVGREHAYTARALYNLAELLLEDGDIDAAGEMCRQAFMLQTKLLDPNHRALAQTRALLDRIEERRVP